jgi:hypothetical protein
MNIVNVADLKAPNGKTHRENNAELVHNIPLGTLVEILPTEYSKDDPEENWGLRLYVVAHTRDCDQTPLYSLSHKREAYKELETHAETKDRYKADGILGLWFHIDGMNKGALLNGYPEYILKPIERRFDTIASGDNL